MIVVNASADWPQLREDSALRDVGAFFEEPTDPFTPAVALLVHGLIAHEHITVSVAGTRSALDLVPGSQALAAYRVRVEPPTTLGAGITHLYTHVPGHATLTLVSQWLAHDGQTVLVGVGIVHDLSAYARPPLLAPLLSDPPLLPFAAPAPPP